VVGAVVQPSACGSGQLSRQRARPRRMQALKPLQSLWLCLRKFYLLQRDGEYGSYGEKVNGQETNKRLQCSLKL
jgi:hypothetical protein